MAIKWVILIGIGAYILGTVTGAFATRDACTKTEDAINKMTAEFMGSTEGTKK